MENEKPKMSEEQRKEALENALARIKLQVRESNNVSVQDRLKQFANRDEEYNPKEKEIDKDKPMSLEELAKAMNKNSKESENIGLISKDMSEKAKDKTKIKDKEKDKERVPFDKNDKNIDGKDEKNDKDKDKNKDKDNEKDPVKKQEQKMKEMFSKIKLPSEMEIRQEGPQWVLVSGRQRINITDVMNTIDKYNKDVDAANHENKMHNDAQSSVDKAVDVNKKEEGLNVNETNSKVKIVSEALPLVKDTDGNQVFKPEDIKDIAEIALKASDEKALLQKLYDPKALEELQERDRKNRDKEEIAKNTEMLKANKEQSKERTGQHNQNIAQLKSKQGEGR